jgi:hypothetical protein
VRGLERAGDLAENADRLRALHRPVAQQLGDGAALRHRVHEGGAAVAEVEGAEHRQQRVRERIAEVGEPQQAAAELGIGGQWLCEELQRDPLSLRRGRLDERIAARHSREHPLDGEAGDRGADRLVCLCRHAHPPSSKNWTPGVLATVGLGADCFWGTGFGAAGFGAG